jgi:hypothetical protein
MAITTWNYIVVKKKRTDIQTFFSTTPYAAIPPSGILLWKAVKLNRIKPDKKDKSKRRSNKSESDVFIWDII